jgi:methionyl-tRNA formyltransferase
LSTAEKNRAWRQECRIKPSLAWIGTDTVRKLVFFGNERLATATPTTAPTLRALVEAGYDVQAVITNHKEMTRRNQRPLEIAAVAHTYHIPVELPGSKHELLETVKKYPAEAAVLVAYGRIIPQEVLDLFPKGIINIHPSLLPKLRGTTPVETTILNGYDETGVSLMKLVAEMDAGPVYAQESLELNGTETKHQLADTLLNMGCELLMENLADILSGKLEPKVQDETEATYTRMLSKDDGLLDFTEAADAIERKIRAYLGFPRTRAMIFDKDLVITAGRVAASPNDGHLVMTCQPGYLEILELIGPSGRSMSGADFIRGYKK